MIFVKTINNRRLNRKLLQCVALNSNTMIASLVIKNVLPKQNIFYDVYI